MTAGFGNQGRAKIMITPETGVKFENVAGIDEAGVVEFPLATLSTLDQVPPPMHTVYQVLEPQ